uniref:Uncharacterized protein n=1 Tax=Amphimedon queenslandica TaxID=400682 RepID=A0A1X7TLX2_AMPQE
MQQEKEEQQQQEQQQQEGQQQQQDAERQRKDGAGGPPTSGEGRGSRGKGRGGQRSGGLASRVQGCGGEQGTGGQGSGGERGTGGRGSYIYVPEIHRITKKVFHEIEDFANTLEKYFSKAILTLPDPTGSLKSEIPLSSIKAANGIVQSILKVRKNGVDGEKPKQKRSKWPYSIYTAEEKARIGRRHVKMGVTNSMKFFDQDFEDRPLKKSTVKSWAKEYNKELVLRNNFKRNASG